ncbi:MAG: site-specific integrase [Gemmatimonadota bacterium]|nr:MAG: site-specific integrase [Gemmatimonadota bacterium]
MPVIPYTSGRRWQLCPVSSGFRPFRRKEKAAKETCNNDLIAVSVLATYCMDQGWIKQRPKIKKFKTRVRIRYLEPDQVTVYMASLRGAFRLLFQVLIGTGLRFGEAAGLRVCDLRFGACEARALIEDSKTQNGVRTVFIPDWITDGLKKEIEARELSGTDRIFTIPYDTCYDEHKRACKLAGIVNYTIHDHRHTAAVALARSGMPLHMLAEQLGHATIQMTMRYAKFNPDYGDVSPYFQRVAQSFGLTSGSNPGSTSPKEKTGAPA